MTIWVLRVVWVSLPVTAGPAAADALDSWSAAPRVGGEVLLWAAWTVALVALLAPRPAGLTTLRVVAPAFAVLSVAAAATASSSGFARVSAVVTTFVALGLVLSPPVSIAAANGVAYGDERRYPLKTPPALMLGPLPLVPLVLAAGIATGPLLLADRRWLAGALATLVGLPAAAFLARALHGLSRRWVVLVPAGLVLADPMTLPDPVLFMREHIASLRAVVAQERLPDGALDLRLGAGRGSMGMTLDQPIEYLQTRRGIRGSAATDATELRFAAVGSRDLLACAARRRIRVG